MKSFVLSLLLCLASISAGAQPVDLLISEYIEGSSFNKAVELYNGTGAAVDLGEYTLELYSNGSPTVSQSLMLSGTLADGDVYVLAHGSSDGAIERDITNNSVINFNGDDAVVLRKGGAVVDAFGQVGFDPGSAWGSGSTSTQNNTLRRLAGDCTADTDAGDVFDPGAHYEGFGNDTFGGFGSHSSTCGSGGGGGGNAAPQFTAELTDQIVPSDALFSFTYEASDADAADVLTYTLDEGPAAATLDATTGAFEWTPSAAQEGQAFTVTVTVSDGEASDVTSAVLTVASTTPSEGDLLISEYVEGSSFNKALELFNSSDAAIDLSAYSLEVYFNGNTSAGQSLTLSGVLAGGDVYVVGHTSAGPAIQDAADATHGGVTNFNGDDAIVLTKNGSIIDVIGQVGVDPGSQWGSGLASTADNTLRRLASDCTGDANPGDAFDPAVKFEGFAQDTFDGLGAHTATCSGGGGGSDNEAPVFTTALPDTLLENGETLEFTFVATDTDGDALTFSLLEAPTGAALGAAGTLSWTAAGAGIHTFTVAVSDGEATTVATAYAGVQGVLFAGETGATLRESIRASFTPSQTMGYDVARDTMYLRIDRDPDGKVRGVYTGFGVDLPDGVDPSSYLAANGINAEHTWPQSMGAADEPGRSDMHNLFPSKDNVNSARSNKPYSEIPDHQTDTWYRLDQSQTDIPASDIDLYSESAAGYFEPRELHKGNAARAGLYFFTIYEGVSNASFLLEQRQTFVDWNALDVVDGSEIGRAGQISERQGNVNPFLIDPTLAERAVSDITPPPVITIAEAREENDGALVTIEGIVTRAGGRFTRVQDATAALATFQSTGALRAAVESGDVARGDLLRVTGTMDTFNGLRQLSPSLFEVVSRGNALPAAPTVTLADIAADGEAYESELIRVVGLQIDPAGDAVFQAATTYQISDASDATGAVALRTPSGSEGAIIGEPIPTSFFTFVGVLGEFRADYQLQPIDAGDVEADGEPPVITLIDGPATLAKPNHTYQAFSLDDLVVSVVDAVQGDLPASSVIIESVTSDEAENGDEDGNTINDIAIGTDCRSVDLRSERQGDGNGRVYTIHLAASDAAGNVGAATYEVHVLISSGVVVVDDGVAYTVDAECSVTPVDAVKTSALEGARDLDAAVAEDSRSEAATEVPAEFALSPAYPNPFNPQATVTMTVETDQHVRIEVFNIVGQRVAVLHDGTLSAGRLHAFTFQAGSLPSGTYVLQATGAKITRQQLLTLLK